MSTNFAFFSQRFLIKCKINTKAAKSAKSEATEFVIIEPGEATKNEEGKLVITKKAKVFAVTPSTPFNS